MFALLLALTSPRFDATAWELLKKNRDAMLALQGYRAEACIVSENPGDESQKPRRSFKFSTIVAGRPKLMRYRKWESETTAILKPQGRIPDFETVTDGETDSTAYSRTYLSILAPGIEHVSFGGYVYEAWDGFFDGRTSLFT